MGQHVGESNSMGVYGGHVVVGRRGLRGSEVVARGFIRRGWVLNAVD